jgi:pyruvate formate lyase activating enzyme
MRDIPPTPVTTLRRARDIAREAGLRYVYLGNVPTDDGGTTFCPECHGELVVRRGYGIVDYRLTASGNCPDCGVQIPGRWSEGAGREP